MYISIMNIMVIFILLVLYLLLTIGFPCLNLYTENKKIRHNALEAPFGILGASNETKNDFSVKPIVESKIGFLLG